jgi:5-methylcytosine-specific restriction protein A
MAKLKTLRPSLGTLAPRVGTMETIQRDERQGWRKWYGTVRWARLRAFILLRDIYTCRMCGRIATRPTVDHVEPHRGDPRLFWDPENLQTLCKSPCHDKHKQAQEVAGHAGW